MSEKILIHKTAAMGPTEALGVPPEFTVCHDKNGCFYLEWLYEPKASDQKELRRELLKSTDRISALQEAENLTGFDQSEIGFERR